MVDYGLARRATLAALRGTGATTREDVCDAHPYLLRAARHHGEPTGRECPVCRDGLLVDVQLRLRRRSSGAPPAGSRRPAELEEMAREHDEFRVYVVEVCVQCSWNHLVRSYVLGAGVSGGAADRRAARR